MGLGRCADSGPGRHCLGRPAAQTAVARQSERVLLRSRSHQWQDAASYQACEEAVLGDRDRGRWPSHHDSQQRAYARGNKICPSLEGATNWYSPSFNPVTGLFYVQTNEKCAIFRKTPTEWQAGKGYMAGTWVTAPGDQPQRVLRAFSLKTGAVAWELPEIGQGDSWGGTLSTVGGLVFFGDDAGALVAADGSTGKPLWQFEGNQLWKSSPMTYMFDHKQYVAVATGPNIISFAGVTGYCQLSAGASTRATSQRASCGGGVCLSRCGQRTAIRRADVVAGALVA